MPKNLINRTQIVGIICFLIIFLLSFRFFLLNEGSFGHNWDWSFPALRIFYKNIDWLSKYTWNRFNFGYANDLVLVHLIPSVIFKLLGQYFEPKSILLIIFAAITSISFIGFKKLLDSLISVNNFNFIPAFLFAFSPFLFNDIIGGSWPMWVSFAFSPLYFIFFVNYLKTSRYKFLFFLLAISNFIIISIQHFVLVNVLAVFYIGCEILTKRYVTIKLAIIRISPFFICLFLINLYWLLPFSYSLGNFTKNIILKEGGGNEFDPIKNSTQSIWNILNLGGYLDRNMYLYSLPLLLKLLINFVVFIAIVSLFYCLIFIKNSVYKRKLVFWSLFLLVLILIVKGGNSPFAGFTLWFYNSFPLMKLYRSPQHLMFIPAFIIPILFALLLYSLVLHFVKFKKAIILGSIVVIAIWTSGWWYSGDLGSKTLLKQGRDHIDFYKLPPELIKYYEQSEKDRDDYRTFFLPASFSPFFLKTKYQNEAQGVQPEYMYLNKPTFISESNKFAENMEISFCKEANFGYIRYLSLFSVKNIILRSDIYPKFTESAKCWDDDLVRDRLDSSAFLERFLTGRYASAYKIKDDYFLPHFYIPQRIIYSNGNVEDLPEIMNFGDYQLRSGIYLGENGKWKMENGNLTDRADEIFVKAELENAVTEEELGINLPIVSFPYVRNKPGGLMYRFVLMNEQFDKWKVRNEPEKLFEKHLFYANKRVSEIEKYGNTDIERYKEEMMGALGELRDLRELGNKDFSKLLTEYQGTIAGHLKKLGELREMKEVGNWEALLKELEKEVEGLKTKRDFSKLAYEIEVPKEGEYEIFIKNTSSVVDFTSEESLPFDFAQGERDTIRGGYQSVDYSLWEERYFEKGAQELVLPFSGISENLVDENLRIKDYAPNSIYRISFDYKAPRGGGFFIAEGKEGEIARTDLLSTGDEFKHFEMFFKSSLKVADASVHLSISVAEEKNLEVRRIYQPELVLRHGTRDTGHEIPKITFVKINPTKYRVKVEGASQPYTLVFSESFHEGWKAHINTQHATRNTQHEYGNIIASYFDGEIEEGTHKNIFLDGNTFETWGKKPLPEERHLLVNGYANSWYIRPEDVGGQENYEIIVEFQPQKLFYIGLGISLTTLLGCLGYLGIAKINELRK